MKVSVNHPIPVEITSLSEEERIEFVNTPADEQSWLLSEKLDVYDPEEWVDTSVLERIIASANSGRSIAACSVYVDHLETFKPVALAAGWEVVADSGEDPDGRSPYTDVLMIQVAE